ncbi:MAG: nucleotide exchange factor GrpE [Lachnospiraceae bacterium]|nr:nucleotide exchange factor GrpE [Lachnospiraceae bacterium]
MAENLENENLTPDEEEMLEEVIEDIAEEADGEVVEDVEDNENETETKLVEMTDKCQRLAAEYYNYRERTAKEKASMYSDGARDTVEKILPVIDNLERAVAAQSTKCGEDDSFFKGVEMTLKQFKEILNAMGVEEIPAKGEKFDPNLHSAVSHIEDDNFGENEITIEMMKGYKYKEKVIRHSMVQVAN